MRYLILCSILGMSMTCLAQSPDNAPWSPAGAVWVYSDFSATTNRNLVISYIKDTTIGGRKAKKMENKRVEFLDTKLSVKTETVLGYDYYLNSNDSLFLWEDNAFRFIYDFTPAVADQWTIGTKKITCPNDFPLSGTMRVDSIKQVSFGSSLYSVIYNNGQDQNYVLGPIIKNIGPLTGPYPFVNRNKCSVSGGLFQGLVCYSDGTRGLVDLPNSMPALCRSATASIGNNAPLEADKDRTIYPNPVESILQIKGRLAAAASFNYIIFDASGRAVASGIYTGAGISVGSLRPGFYVLQVQGRYSKKEVFKFLKK
ncbi:MAG TPA: T9SS type A sorting domain-containing protein [Flavisolibacter sp.]|nr:T9SS type A sorting domain-containing protein [Flavisolibacter sp.]